MDENAAHVILGGTWKSGDPVPNPKSSTSMRPSLPSLPGRMRYGPPRPPYANPKEGPRPFVDLGGPLKVTANLQSRGSVPILSRDPQFSFFSKTPPKTLGKQLVIDKMDG